MNECFCIQSKYGLCRFAPHGLWEEPRPCPRTAIAGVSFVVEDKDSEELAVATRRILDKALDRAAEHVTDLQAGAVQWFVDGGGEYGTNHRLGKIGDGIRLWANIDPNLLLAVFLPALLFESSFLMEVHQIKRCLMQMFLLAGPGVLISTFCLGAALKFAFPYDWSWKTSLLLGGLLSATDPVAVVALLKELGASKKLNTIIEGESLMNDGTAIVVYQLFYRMVRGWNFNWGAIIKFLSQVSLGAVGIGLAFGIASVLWLGFIFNDTVIEITLTLAVSYIAFFTAQEGLDISGVLTVMTLGICVNGFLEMRCIGRFYSAVRTAFKGESQQSLHHFWYISLINVLSSHRDSENSPYISSDTGSLFVFLTGGVVFLTLIVNGSTTQFLLHFLKMDRLSAAKKEYIVELDPDDLTPAMTAAPLRSGGCPMKTLR
ncbi:hypothetical protein CDL12_13529 [Handroanthus impetiginosus]|uniref:Cation/H+ exchanger transmembrane domain-containing protein n=1 Tax=Handroanthus impetiginosus TaxID=429701 RepID=A0A2G9H8J8_9LAMI|nr:hypothetical protein CDL12_13529 [Handroanthus impetiginosus]